nr:PAS domain-containing protein [Domibacillus iocasae]
MHQEEKIVYTNPESLKMLGANHENEILGKRIQEIFVIEEVDRLQDCLERLLNGESLPFCEYRIKMLNGRVIDVESNTVNITFPIRKECWGFCF